MSTNNMAASWRQANDVIAPGWLKQYLRTQAGTAFTSACVAVMWRIPPPNSSPTSTCPPYFSPCKLMTFSSAQVMRSLQSRNLYILLSMAVTKAFTYL